MNIIVPVKYCDFPELKDFLIKLLDGEYANACSPRIGRTAASLRQFSKYLSEIIATLDQIETIEEVENEEK